MINYLSAIPNKSENNEFRSSWNIYDSDYLKKLHRIANINQFWINSPECDNLKFHHQRKINWITDKINLFKELFFTYEIRDGNFMLIKPDGKFFYYLGEHGKQEVWEVSKKFFK